MLRVVARAACAGSVTAKLESGNFLVEYTSHKDGDDDTVTECTAAQVCLVA